jgi:hypothetical protein
MPITSPASAPANRAAEAEMGRDAGAWRASGFIKLRSMVKRGVVADSTLLQSRLV